jgi:polyhydroxyalkanoate synthesis regulator phasin
VTVNANDARILELTAEVDRLRARVAELEAELEKARHE